MNISCIIVDKAIPGITGPAYNKCTTLAEVLAALAAAAGVDVHAVSGVYEAATENIVITLSNGSTFSIPAALLLPVVADGVTITGNGTSASPLIGYQVAYNATTGALTITAPGGVPVVIAQQTATTEPAIDTQNLLGNGAGSTATTQQLLDNLAATSHPRATVEAASNPALTLNPATQIANLNLDAAGSYTNTTSGLTATSVQDAIDELAASRPGAPIPIPATAFADQQRPTEAEAAAWVAANHPTAPSGQQYTYAGYGVPDAADYVWSSDGDGTITRLDEPRHLTIEIPLTAFADPANPTIAEAAGWIDTNGPYAPGTTILYPDPADPDNENPLMVWLVQNNGDAINLKDQGKFFVTTGPDATTIANGPIAVDHGDRLHLWGNSLSFAVVAGSALVQGELTPPTQSAAPSAALVGGVLNVPNPAPVAAFAVTSKIGIKATLAATSSSGTQQGNTLAYSWSASGPGATTFTTPAGTTTAATFASPGAYTLTLTVTDTNGNTASQSQTLNVARVLHVNSPNADANDYLATVTAALAWKAANDSANIYDIIVHGQVTEPAAITNADRVHIHYLGGASSSFANTNGYVWTTAPVDLELTGTTKDPYNPAVIVTGGTNNFALSIGNIDATNLKISQIAFARLGGNNGGRASDVQNVNNLRMFNVGFRALLSTYNTFFHQTNNLHLESCTSIGDGIAWGFSTPLGVTNARCINLYGELSNTPDSNAPAPCYLPAATAPGTPNDLTLIDCTFVNRGAGNNAVGIARTPILIGGSANTWTNGIKVIGCHLIQTIAANPIVRSQSVQAERNTLHFIGNTISGGTGLFSNCAPNPAATFNATNAILA